VASRTLLISDLHLEESREDITQAFLRFLQSNSGNCDTLYILGDLFEVWIGDDEETPLTDTIAKALKQFSGHGTTIKIMHGNRDFLIANDYATKCGASLINDPAIVPTPDGPVLLLHGDSLCIDDLDYMQFRDMVRQTLWQQEFLSKPLSERRQFAREAREQSQKATSAKQNSIIDVNQSEVKKLLVDTGQTTMIHGHTHRPAEHQITLAIAVDNQHLARRIVLGDWDKNGWYAEITESGIKLQSFELGS